MKEINGMEVSVKDSKRFAATNGWVCFTLGNHAEPYEQTAAELPESECAFCHQQYVVKTNMTWGQLCFVVGNDASR